MGDVLRATIVCADGDTLHAAWVAVSSPAGFDVRPGHGRLKNLMATTLPRPPCMLINCIIDSDDGHRPVLAEVQIELHSIIQLAMAQHKYYEIRRAKTTNEICPVHTVSEKKEHAARKSSVLAVRSILATKEITTPAQQANASDDTSPPAPSPPGIQTTVVPVEMESQEPVFDATC